MSTYECEHAALAVGNRIANSLGEDWKVRAWENLGWHSDVYRDGVTVWDTASYDGKESYYCLIGSGKRPGTGRYKGDGDTPVKAIKAAVADAMESLKHDMSLVTNVLEAARLVAEDEQ